MSAITDEMADAFNKVMRDRAAIYGRPVEPGLIREDTKAALEAVAPLIAAQALTEAADELEHVADTLWNRSALRFQGWEHMLSDLRNRADKLEREAGQ